MHIDYTGCHPGPALHSWALRSPEQCNTPIHTQQHTWLEHAPKAGRQVRDYGVQHCLHLEGGGGKTVGRSTSVRTPDPGALQCYKRR